MKRLTLDQFNRLYLEYLEESERVEHADTIIARCYHPDLGRILSIMDTKEGMVIIHRDYDSLSLGKRSVLNTAGLKTACSMSDKQAFVCNLAL